MENASISIIKKLPLVSSVFVFNAVVACTTVWTLVGLIHVLHRQTRTTRLRGPPSPSFLYGFGRMFQEAENSTIAYESWAKTYGGVYKVPSAMGGCRIILYDPKALAHLWSKDTCTYGRTPTTKKALEQCFGRGLSWADGESHRRQRKSLNPAFSVPAIRDLTSIYYDSVYKAKVAWAALVELSGKSSTLIDVQDWMNRISLDTIGLAGFSHDFGTLDGKDSLVTHLFDTISSTPHDSLFNSVIGILSHAFPFLMRLPTPLTKLFWRLNGTMEEVSNLLIARTKREFDIDSVGRKEEKSIIGLLIKGHGSGSEFHLSREEILAQMKVLLAASYATTSIVLTWSFIELSRNPDTQMKLRNELLKHGSDPTYDQLSNGLPYLDAVVHEILRIHSPLLEVSRMAEEDDVIPLSEPVCTGSGQLVTNVSISKGTTLSVPLASINTSTAIWGQDARRFKPARWLEDDQGRNGIPEKAKELLGHRHLLTFADGPRTCIGKTFAITEIKVVLSVLIKNFVFELRDGVETKIELGRGFLPRPRVAGETGSRIPLCVKPYAE